VLVLHRGHHDSGHNLVLDLEGRSEQFDELRVRRAEAGSDGADLRSQLHQSLAGLDFEVRKNWQSKPEIVRQYPFDIVVEIISDIVLTSEVANLAHRGPLTDRVVRSVCDKPRGNLSDQRDSLVFEFLVGVRDVMFTHSTVFVPSRRNHMGRLTHMFGRQTLGRVAGVLAAMLLTTTCALEQPVSVSDRPLADRITERPADGQTPEVNSGAAVVPDSLAFSDSDGSGDLLRVSVVDDDVLTPLRSGPGSGFDQIAEIPSGAEVLATGNETGEWVHVLYGDFDGWIMAVRARSPEAGSESQTVDAAEAQSTPVVYVVSGEAIGVNIRTEPDASSLLVSGAAVGANVVGTGETQGAWIEVIYDGVTGWASGNYLEPVGASGQVPSGDG
jgi:uncharacterized protein YraI